MRFLGIIVAIVGVAASLWLGSKKWTEKSTEFQREAAFAKLRGDYLERVAWIRSNPDEKAYKDEVQTFFRWYFKEVNEHLNKFQGNRKFDDYLQELNRKAGAKGEFAEYEGPSRAGDKSAEKKAAFEYTMKQFEAFKSGSYQPLWSATDRGVRLDIVSASTQTLGGETKIHMPVVAWGVPREEKVDDRGVRRIQVNGSFRFNWKLYDEKQKLIAEIPGEGGPDSRVDWPERYIRYFPPMIIFGHYDLDKLPPEAKTAEISFTISGRSPSGGDVTANYLWKLDVPAEWKLQPGEAWKGAQESIRPEEEIDPAKRNKK